MYCGGVSPAEALSLTLTSPKITNGLLLRWSILKWLTSQSEGTQSTIRGSLKTRATISEIRAGYVTFERSKERKQWHAKSHGQRFFVQKRIGYRYLYPLIKLPMLPVEFPQHTISIGWIAALRSQKFPTQFICIETTGKISKAQFPRK